MVAVNVSKGIVLDVDFEALAKHPAVVDAALKFAVKQALTNTHAGIKKADDPDGSKSKALAEKRLEAMMAGTWAQVERASRVDAVTREMRLMAEADVKAKLPKIGKKVSDFKPELWKEIVSKQVASNEANYRAAAEAKLAIQPESGDESADDIMAMLAGE